MARNKKSFITYTDWRDTFNALPDEKAGQLIKHIFAYVNDENPKTEDVLINAVFANIKQTLKRDLRKYENIREKRSEAGRISANKKQQTSTKSTHVNKRQQNQHMLTNVNKRQHVLTCANTKEHMYPVNDNVNDNVNVNVNDSENKKRIRKPFSPPSLIDVQNYFRDNGYNPEIGKKAFMSYDVANWIDSKGKPVINWKQKMINVWFKEENKINGSQSKLMMP